MLISVWEVKQQVLTTTQARKEATLPASRLFPSLRFSIPTITTLRQSTPGSFPLFRRRRRQDRAECRRRRAGRFGKGRPRLAIRDAAISWCQWTRATDAGGKTHSPYHMPHSLTRSTQTLRVRQSSTLVVVVVGAEVVVMVLVVLVVGGQGGLEKVGQGLQSGIHLCIGVNRVERQARELVLTRRTICRIH